MRPISAFATILTLTVLCACSADSDADSAAAATDDANPNTTAANSPNANRNAYFGDLHVHTRYSFDAFIFGTIASPDDAYRFARGQALTHPSGYDMRLAEPLDFYAVTDHAAFLGTLPAMADPSTEVSKRPVAELFVNARTAAERGAAFRAILPYFRGEGSEELLDGDVLRSAWADIVASANRHYVPGEFTTFVAYEYTSAVNRSNLHRNVIFRGDEAPEVPFSRLDSPNPEDLWAWMDEQRSQGMEVLAIPHNSNGSNGQMFKPAYFDDRPLDADYAAMRMRNEPLVEVTQVKGTSETHPLLSPNDEWANFEIMPFRIATSIKSNISGSYTREAHMVGLRLAEERGFNPFKFGLIGSSDSHNASYAGDESSFYSKVGLLDGLPTGRGSVAGDVGEEEGPLDVYRCPAAIPTALSGETESPMPLTCGEDAGRFSGGAFVTWGASGLAGAWAEENTRESIYDSFRRKETFGTSGPRIRVRFFGGYDFADDLTDAPDMVARAYAGGVPMGGDLMARAGAQPRFLVWAARDALSAPLQRVQVIKGWVAGGETHEQVYDVACSDGLEVDAGTHRCPDNGASVDISDCSISSDSGAAQLMTLWTDPDFDASQRALYYVRVLENPTCRWSTWDAMKAGVAPRPDLQATIQERAWSSPIWYVPAG
ncbi:MAG TPA: hypothetical protein DCF71_08260 [Gemmatimonadetes bacterium]|nr:hypothetical protein [Gemmatimonadota bacterium]